MKLKWMRWIGVALLSASWLFGLGYYHQLNFAAWLVMVVTGTLCLTGAVSYSHLPGKLETSVAMVLLIPGLWLSPWPYRTAFLLLIIGLALHLFPIPRPWPKYLGSAALVSGMVLLGQSLAMLAYMNFTARGHELPWPLPHLLGRAAQLLGFEAAVNGQSIGLFSMRKVHLLGATWELFLDPPTFCFLVGGIILLALLARDNVCGPRRGREWFSAISKFTGSVILWLPVRSGLLMAIYMHRSLRTGYDTPLKLMNQFWSHRVHLLLLAGPVLLAWKFTHRPYSQDASPADAAPDAAPADAALADAAAPAFSSLPHPNSYPPHPSRWRFFIPVGLIFVAMTFLTAGIVWDPAGHRKSGRVLVDEYHSTWEPTQRPYDTNWYGQESGYNYACIFDYGSRFYQMSRLNTPIDHKALADGDVLIVKVPTSPYKPEEIETIHDFVSRGGGLMLVGEHTNVFKTGTHINEIARTFGFTFRYDCLFSIDSIFNQLYRLPLIPHPIIQHIPPMDFAVSCSIDPGKSSGRAVICSYGLWSLPADYHASNFYPQVEQRAEARYGAFIQLWATRCGAGKVVGFADSTIFSNFSTFEPGKSELMLGMIEWLNHKNTRGNPRPWLILTGLVLLAGGLGYTYAWDTGYLLLLSAGIFAWAITAFSVRTMHNVSLPPAQKVRPMVQVMIDRTICDTPLSQSGFIGLKKDGFGVFGQWIHRLGYFTSRRSDASVFDGDLLVLFYPRKEVSDTFRKHLVSYVASGGKVLILDSPENEKSTANSLLYPFGLTLEQEYGGGDHVIPDTPETGGSKILQTDLLEPPPQGWPVDKIGSYCKIRGGQPFIRIQGEPVAAHVRYGQGLVTVIGIGTLFNDYNMGATADVVPDASLRQVFELEFSILRAIIKGKFES